jgi:predicted permease
VRERKARRASIVDDVRGDVRFAGRQMRRSPAFALLAILTVALGIGANTAIFSIVHHVLLEPLPFQDGNRIVVFSTGPEHETDTRFQFVFGVPALAMRRMETASRTVSEVSGVYADDAVLDGESRADTVNGAAITPSFLPMLRVDVVLGRRFTVQDTESRSPPVALISYGVWQERFGGARDVLGKVLKVNGLERSIVGVTPPGLAIPILDRGPAPAVWTPLDVKSGGDVAMVFARLRPGATSSLAASELQSFAVGLPEFARSKGLRVYAATALDTTSKETRRAIEILFVTVCGLLLIGCANLANLLFMRGWTRQREFAVRRAIGAGRARLVRQLLTESLALSVCGGAVGLLIAWLGLRLARGFEYVNRADVNGSVLMWTLALSTVTGLVFGVGPALWSTKGSMSDALRAGARGIAGNNAARRVRGALIVGEIALSLCFLVAATLLERSFIALERTPIGYDPRGLAVVHLRAARKPAEPSRLTLGRQVAQSVRAVPGIEEAVIGPEPQTEVRPGPFAIDEPTGPKTVDLSIVEMPFVEPSYFRVARIALVEGRSFGPLDEAMTSQELVVNLSLARRLWPTRDPLGARLRVGDGKEARWLTVVGVAHDLHLPGTNGDLFNLQMYRPVSAAPEFERTMLIRFRGPLAAIELPLKQAVAGAGIGVTVVRLESVESTIDNRVLARPRRALIVFAIFAILAVAISVIGLYGVVAYAVTQRTREIGLRMALGADSVAVAKLVLGDSGRLVVMGGVLGLLIACAATRSLRAFLFDITPTDAVAFLGATAFLIVVALMATLAPTWRALRIDPNDALRAD